MKFYGGKLRKEPRVGNAQASNARTRSSLAAAMTAISQIAIVHLPGGSGHSDSRSIFSPSRTPTMPRRVGNLFLASKSGWQRRRPR